MSNDTNTKREYTKSNVALFANQLGSSKESVIDTLVEFAKANIDQFDAFADNAGSLVAVGPKGRKADPAKKQAVNALKGLTTEQLLGLLKAQGISVSA